MLEIRDLSFAVNEADSEKEIIHNLSLTIENGKFVVITGPNGSGKSTLARLIMGIEKPIAGQILLMAQAGQYNVPRCLKHGEAEAAQLASVEFVRSAASAVFLLNRRYQPYYKWTFRALRGLPELSELAEPLSKLLARPDTDTIEAVSAAVIAALQAQELSAAEGTDLERHAYAVNNTIRDSELRNLHILAGV